MKVNFKLIIDLVLRQPRKTFLQKIKLVSPDFIILRAEFKKKIEVSGEIGNSIEMLIWNDIPHKIDIKKESTLRSGDLELDAFLYSRVEDCRWIYNKIDDSGEIIHNSNINKGYERINTIIVDNLKYQGFELVEPPSQVTDYYEKIRYIPYNEN